MIGPTPKMSVSEVFDLDDELDGLAVPLDGRHSVGLDPG